MLQLFCVLDTRMCVTKSYVPFSWLVSKIYTVSWAVTVAATYCRCMYDQEEVCYIIQSSK